MNVLLQIGAIAFLATFALVVAYAMISDVGFLGFVGIIVATALFIGSMMVLDGSGWTL